MSDKNKAGEIFTKKLTEKMNLFEFSGDYKLKRKICENIKNNGKFMISLSAILSKDNFFKYDYKNIKEALNDIFLENEIFSFYPKFIISKEDEDEEFNYNTIGFDICLTFNENCIKKESGEIIDIMNESVKSVRDDNKNIVPFYLYRMMKEERCFFYPVELLVKQLMGMVCFEYSLKELFMIFLKNEKAEPDEEDVVNSMKNELFLSKENTFLNFTKITGDEALFLNKKEIDGLIDFGLKAKETGLMFLRQNLRFNIRYNSLMEEIISYFNEYLINNPHVAELVRKNLPAGKKNYIDNIDIFNFDEVVRTVTDVKFLAGYHIPEKYRKEFTVISQYISENQKFFLDNIELSNTEENFSRELKDEIRNELKMFLSNILTNIILQRNAVNIIFDYQDFLSLINKSVKKDKNIVLKIFNSDIKNRLCFVIYFKFNEISEEMEFFNQPVNRQVIVIPLAIMKEIALLLIRAGFSNYYESKNNIFIYMNVLKLILRKPEIVFINPESDESFKLTGFYGRNDLKDTIDLLEMKYEDIKSVIKEDELIALKQEESDNLKKHRIFNSLRMAILFVQKMILRDRYYKNIKKLDSRFEQKLNDKEFKDQKEKKRNVRENNRLNPDEYENERKRIASLIDNMNDDERRLFNNIYNCIKNKGGVEYEYRDKKLKVEIYLKTSVREESPQMYICLSDTLHSLAQSNFIMLDRRNIRLTGKIKKYFNIG
jgi:hypothetical protein